MARIRRGRSHLAVALLAGMLLAPGGCNTGGDRSESDAGTTNMPDTSTAASIDSTIEEQAEVVVRADDPFSVFGLETLDAVDATIDTTPAWLVNGLASALIVTADAAAGSVVVDTISPGDSILVRIATRAAFVELSARTSDGRSGGAVSLRADGKPARVAFPR